jgi:hypothetical protein
MGSEQEQPPPWYTGGPYLLVALPGVFDEFIPLNASSLIREWESMLDPLRVLGWAAKEFLPLLTWTVGEKYVTPSFATIEWMRRASRDERLTMAFANGRGDVALGGRYTRPLNLPRFVTHDEGDEEVLEDQAMPVLLGLAVLGVLTHGIGRASVAISEKLPDDIQHRVDQQRAEDELSRRERESRGILDELATGERELVQSDEAEFSQGGFRGERPGFEPDPVDPEE